MRKSFTKHPMFFEAASAANEGLKSAVIYFGVNPAVLDRPEFETACNRIVDDLTKLLLRTEKKGK